MTRALNVFALHYYLWFAALTPIYGYVSVYAEHYANASSGQYGLLNMVLPFAAIVAKLFFCSLADRHQAYRTFFVWFLITALVGYGSFGILPLIIQPQPKELGLNINTWVLICIMTSLSTISMGVISCLSDSFAMNSATQKNTSYGRIRLWGTLGWASGSFAISFINQTDKLPLLVPGLFLTIGLLFFDIIVAIIWPRAEDFKLNSSISAIEASTSGGNLEHDICQSRTSQIVVRPCDYGSTETYSTKLAGSKDEYASVKVQWLLFKEVAKRRISIFRYALLFTISGALISLQWSYFFQYLKQIYPADFAFITGLSMIGQSMLGELPFFILSKVIVEKLGRTHTLSLSITTIGIRYFLYHYLLPNASMYYVLATEAFQGPNFGLFYVVMTEVGLDYSDCDEAILTVADRGIIDKNPRQLQKLRQALRATMQSVMSACYEGLGLGIGSIVGGVVIDQYGFENLWFWAAITAILLGLCNLAIDIIPGQVCKHHRAPVAAQLLKLNDDVYTVVGDAKDCPNQFGKTAQKRALDIA